MGEKQIYTICFSIIAASSILIGSCLLWSFMNVAPKNEWPDNIILIIEVAIGIIVSTIVFMIAKINEIKIDEKITSVLNIVEEREKVHKEREKVQKEKEHFMQEILYKTLEQMDYRISQILSWIKEYNCTPDTSSKQKYKEQIISRHKQIYRLAEERLDNSWITWLDFFDSNTVKKLKTISSLCKNKPTFKENDYLVLQGLIQSQIDDLVTKVGTLETRDFKSKEKSEDKHVPISVSVDRSVYPLDSIVHVQIQVSNIIKGELITCEVLDSKEKLLAAQTLDLATHDNPDLTESNIVQADFRMTGKEWKIHEQYIVRVTYGSSWSEDSFWIDQRMPVVQYDKTVYVVGGDMVITVIDPDADKDSETVEYVGDREDSKLVIESRYGKIDGYRLRETGNSTGIFQGIIGIMGVRRDGSVIPQEFGGKIIDKIQGTGIDNGFIAGARGDELTARYTSRSGTAELTFFISDFGASIELDKRVYRPSDRVRITIVAPDLNIDPNKIDEIGRNPNGIVNIRTSYDRVERYKLAETGLNTGIFTGEIQLERIKSSPKSKKAGSTSGQLLCGSDDFLEISFRMFDDEAVVGKALIRDIA